MGVCIVHVYLFLHLPLTLKALPSPYSGGKGFFATSQKIVQFQEGYFRDRKVCT